MPKLASIGIEQPFHLSKQIWEQLSRTETGNVWERLGNIQIFIHSIQIHYSNHVMWMLSAVHCVEWSTVSLCCARVRIRLDTLVINMWPCFPPLPVSNSLCKCWLGSWRISQTAFYSFLARLTLVDWVGTRTWAEFGWGRVTLTVTITVHDIELLDWYHT